MKLLLDQNISFRVLRLLPEDFAECRHVRTLGLNDHDDWEIWQFAKQHGYTIVTFDADFFDLAVLRGIPPQIVWLRTGNLSTAESAERLSKHLSDIRSFIALGKDSCLEIY